MSFWKRLFVECNFFFTYNEKTNLNILLILSVYWCKKKFFALIQTILYKLNICNVCSNVETQLKENTIFILLYFCVYDVASVKSCYSIAGTNKCFVRVVFLNMCPHDQTSSVCYVTAVMWCVSFHKCSRLVCLWVSDWVNWLGWTGLLDPSPLEGPAIHTSVCIHLYAFNKYTNWELRSCINV